MTEPAGNVHRTNGRCGARTTKRLGGYQRGWLLARMKETAASFVTGPSSISVTSRSANRTRLSWPYAETSHPTPYTRGDHTHIRAQGPVQPPVPVHAWRPSC
mgnify:CR=1 FL=1